MATVPVGSDGGAASISCPALVIFGKRMRLLAPCLSGGSEGFAQRIPVKDPGCREPETGTDETDGIAQGESSKAYLFDQWQAHGS